MIFNRRRVSATSPLAYTPLPSAVLHSSSAHPRDRRHIGQFPYPQFAGEPTHPYPSSTQVSLKLPPAEELTTRVPGLATRVKPPGMT